jgi:hypothetical protein
MFVSPGATLVVTTTTTHVFQSFWWGEELSCYAAFCMKSFVDFGHTFELYSFTPDLKVPSGVCLRDARELFDTGDVFFYRSGLGAGSPSAFSNLFRYKLLAERGGWWVDTDVVCLTAEVPTYHTFFAWEDDFVLGTAILLFPAGHLAMGRCYEEALGVGRELDWGRTGPQLFTRVVMELGMMDEALPANVCYPLRSPNALVALEPTRASLTRARAAQSHFYHVWNEILRRHNVDRNVLPPLGSFLRELADMHPVPGWGGDPEAHLLTSIGRGLQRLTDDCRVSLWLVSDDEAARRTRGTVKLAASPDEITQVIAELIGIVKHDTPLPVPPDFSEETYLSMNPDVAAAVKSGAFSSGFSHYILHGRHEGRLRPSPPTAEKIGASK